MDGVGKMQWWADWAERIIMNGICTEKRMHGDNGAQSTRAPPPAVAPVSVGGGASVRHCTQ